tara:strand:- start:1085 stop:1591 length:507 start_codon:yes stop_codon:yes gene_type:complete
MNTWYKIASKETVVSKVKKVLKEHPFTASLLRYYHIPEKDVDNNLSFEFKDLKGKYAEGNGEKIVLDTSLFVDDEEFIRSNFHFVVHEFFHWLKRRQEENFYFSDSEEVQSFTLGIAWEIMEGKPQQDIVNIYLPIVKKHFNSENTAQNVLHQMFNKALAIVKKLQEV